MKTSEPRAETASQRPRDDGGHPSANPVFASDIVSTIGNVGVLRILHSQDAVQRSGGTGSNLDESVAREIQRRRGGGTPLPGGVRKRMEGAFGQDFSNVRVHTGSDAHGLNERLASRAFTVGSDIFLSRSARNAVSPDGKRLLAHELTHVVQQSGTSGVAPRAVSDPTDTWERQADAAAGSLVSGPAAAARRPVSADAAGTAPLVAGAPLVRRCGHLPPDACPCHGGGPAAGRSHDRPDAPGPPASAARRSLPGTDVLQRQALGVAEAGHGPAPSAKPNQVGAVAGLVVEDDATEPQPNQMRKSEFLDRLHAAVCRELDGALAAVGRSTDNCPYLAALFRHYRGQRSAHIEATVHRYAPEAQGARSAPELIAMVLPRVRGPVERWVSTGELTGVPDDAPLPASVLLAAARAGEGGERDGAAVQRKARGAGGGRSPHPTTVQAQLGAGRPLAAPVRRRMESVFGTDFSSVRTHTDATAARLSSQQDARAFTVGEHVAFAAGEYRPGTPIGDALVAHELAHVAQQRASDRSVARFEDPAAQSPALEADADRSAVSAVVSLWAGAVDTVRGIARRATPSLRSGLQLQRCGRTRCPPGEAFRAVAGMGHGLGPGLCRWECQPIPPEERAAGGGPSVGRAPPPSVFDREPVATTTSAFFNANTNTCFCNPPTDPDTGETMHYPGTQTPMSGAMIDCAGVGLGGGRRGRGAGTSGARGRTPGRPPRAPGGGGGGRRRRRRRRGDRTPDEARRTLESMQEPSAHRYGRTSDPIDPAVRRLAKEVRATQAGVSTEALRTQNVAVARVRVDGEVRYLETGNTRGGGAHAEQWIEAQIHQLSRGGRKVVLEQLYSERIPCRETCGPFLRERYPDAQIYFTTTKHGNAAAADLRREYGLGD